MKNVVVMGGSFNPPTIAHLKLIQTAVDTMNAEAGYLVPVSHAYLKRKMVRAGCGHNEFVFLGKLLLWFPIKPQMTWRKNENVAL